MTGRDGEWKEEKGSDRKRRGVTGREGEWKEEKGSDMKRRGVEGREGEWIDFPLNPLSIIIFY